MGALAVGPTARVAVASLAAAPPVVPTFGHADSCVLHNRLFCWHWFTSHWSDTFQPALIQHIELTLIAVGIGFVMSLTLALIAYWLGWLERPIEWFAGLLYVIPALALFQILVPITGLTTTTVEVALVSYTLLILFRNVLIGLRQVSPDVREAARAMGMTRWQSLVRVELPLAVPAMFAGLRIATVTIVSLATVAAFVVNQGLGPLILRAIEEGQFKTEFVAAGALAVALALIADALLLGARRLLTPWSRSRTG
jgi:osmoprotectant transport system permease protein